jgi:hypothetical protein
MKKLLCGIVMLKLFLKRDKFGGRDLRRHCVCHKKIYKELLCAVSSNEQKPQTDSNCRLIVRHIF